MSSTFNFNTFHKDLIHDVSFDYYGTMLATCSSDQTIKIWKYSNNCDWKCIQEINHIDHTHKAAIQMICWANPIFGSIFASCSTDKKINIFAHVQAHSSLYNNRINIVNSEKLFCYKRVFLDFHSASSIAFVPKHLGLKLSIVCKIGVIKILTARDITNLSQWIQQYSINIADTLPLSVPWHRQMPFMDIANAKNKKMQHIKSFCMSWNESSWELPSFAVGTNKNRVFIYRYFDNGNEEKMERAMTNLSTIKKNMDWHCVGCIELLNKNEKNTNVCGISWSRHLARKYHLLAVGCSDGFVRVIQINRHQRIMKMNMKDQSANNKLEWNVIFESNIHNDSVWKVQWNITGNLLLSAGDDAKIYLWKRNRLSIQEKYVPVCISNPQSNGKKKKKKKIDPNV